MTDVFPSAPKVFDRPNQDRSPLEIQGLLSQPIWGELRTFLAVAKSPSFARAAELLGTSPNTVSRDVKRLQDQLGSHLVMSGFAGIRLTNAGAKLANALAALDFHLFALANDLRDEGAATAGLVSVSVSSGLAAAIVAPAVPQLASRHPKIELDLREQLSFLNFEKNQCDLMVALTPIERADIECLAIGTLHLIPVCGTAYLDRVGSLPKKGALWGHSFLQCGYYQSEAAIWQDWNGLIAEGQLTHRSENSLAYYALVKGGAGIGLLGNYVQADPFVVPLDLGVHVALPIYLVGFAERLKQRAAAAVRDWLVALFAANPFFASELRFYNGQSPAETDMRRLFDVGSITEPDRSR